MFKSSVNILALFFLVQSFSLTETSVLNDDPIQVREDFVCNQGDGFFPVPGQCTATYYACFQGVAYEQTCPGDNIVFDPATQRCTPFNQASCRDLTTLNPGSTVSVTMTVQVTTTTTLPTSTVTVPGGFVCPGDGFFPIPGQCSGTYYACFGGVATEQKCQGDYVFDPIPGRCVPYNEASCRDSTSTVTPSTTVTITTVTAPGGFTCPTSEGFYAIPGTCGSEYYICVLGSPYVTTCPNGGIFDPVVNYCVPEASASCKTTTSTTSTTTTETSTTSTTTVSSTTQSSTTTTATSVPPFTCPSTGNYPYPGSCYIYYVCAGGGYIVAACPPGQAFNPSISFCDDPANVPGCTTFDPDRYVEESMLVGMTGGVMDRK